MVSAAEIDNKIKRGLRKAMQIRSKYFSGYGGGGGRGRRWNAKRGLLDTHHTKPPDTLNAHALPAQDNNPGQQTNDDDLLLLLLCWQYLVIDLGVLSK